MSRGNEGFYIDERGLKADAELHHPTLDRVDDRQFREQSFMRAIQAGISPEDAARMYDLQGGYELGGGSLG